MRFLSFIFLIFTISCGNTTSEEKENISHSQKQESTKDGLYSNGENLIQITQLNDNHYQTTFTNANGFVFDTTMSPATKKDSFLISLLETEDGKLLKFHYGGLLLEDNKLQVLEFSSYGELATLAKMPLPGLYTEIFYKLDERVQIYGEVRRSKDGFYIEDIFLDDDDLNEGFFLVEGIVKREKYPDAYYSTDESPQGMLPGEPGDENYRLIMSDVKLSEAEKQLYEGTAINDEQGRAGFVWKLADSEIFLLHDKKEPWTEEELGKELKIKAFLVQDKTGSRLKDVEYLNG